MRKLAMTLLAGAGALTIGSANASDIYTSGEYANPDLMQQVRMVCNKDGPRAGVGFRAPGVSVGVGVGDRW